MKRLPCVLLALILFVALFTGCDNAKVNKMCVHNWTQTATSEYVVMDRCSICSATRTYLDPQRIPTCSGDEAGFIMFRHNWQGEGITNKEISACDLSAAVMDCLSKLQETGEVIPEISVNEEDIINSAYTLPVQRGTVWLDCGNVGLFRLNPEMTEICKVQTYLGAGKVLEMTETMTQLLQQAWYYHPYDYWSGTYENGTVSLTQVYKSDSAVEWVEIESIHIEDTASQNNNLKLRIRANESKRVKVSLESNQSDDNRGSYDKKEIELIQGGETTVEFTFFGFNNCSYVVDIHLDNTHIQLIINAYDAVTP